MKGGRVGDFRNICQTVWSHGQCASRQEFGETAHRVNGGGTAEFPVVVEGGKDIASAGIGKNPQMSDFRKLLSDGVGATDGQNRARPRGGDALRCGDCGAYS